MVKRQIKRAELQVVQKDSFYIGLTSFNEGVSFYQKRGWVLKEIDAYVSFGRGIYVKSRAIGISSARDTASKYLETAFELCKVNKDSCVEKAHEVYLRYGDVLRGKDQYREAIDIYLQGLRLGRYQSLELDRDLFIGTFFSLFHCYRNIKELDGAKAALDSLEGYVLTENARQQYALHNLKTDYYTITGNYEEAILSSEQKLIYCEKTYGNPSYRYAISLFGQYQLYDLIEERDQSIYHLKEGLKVSRAIESYKQIGTFLYALSSVAYSHGDYQKAANWTTQMKKDLTSFEPFQKMMCMQRRPLIYHALGKHDSAALEAKLLADLIVNTNPKNHTLALNKSAATRSLAEFYLKTGDYEKAEYHAINAIEYIKDFNIRKTAVSDRYCVLARVYLKLEQFEEMASTLEKAAQLYETGDPEKPYEVSPNMNIVTDLRCHLYNSQYQATKDSTFLVLGIRESYRSFYTKYELAGFFSSSKEQMRYKENMRNVASDLVKWSILLSEIRPLTNKELSDLFNAIDKVKVYNLRLKLAGDSEDEAFWGLESGFFDRLIQLKSTIAQLEQEYANAEETAVKEDLQERLAQARKELIATNIELKKNHKSFYTYLYNPPSISIKEVRKQLKPGQTAIFYFQGLEKTYSLAINATDSRLAALAKNERLNACIEALNTSILNKNISQYAQNAARLYRTLIEGNMALGMEQLLLVPDENLYVIPWDALLTDSIQKETYSKMPFAIKKHLHTVALSANFLFRSAERETQKLPVEVLSFGRSFSENQEYPFLSKALEETEQVSKLFSSSKIFTEQDATEENFALYANQANILHFATHAESDLENPMKSKLVLHPSSNSDGYLYLHELVGKELNSSLAVLSACNSGKGILKTGDGFINLGYGFAYAGCENAILTLWSSPDAITAEIVGSCLKHIANGDPFNEALRAAKLSFLSKADNATSAPFFWSGITYVGASDANIPEEGSNTIWMGLFIGVAFAIALGVRSRKRKHAA